MEKVTDFGADHEPKFMIAGKWGPGTGRWGNGGRERGGGEMGAGNGAVGRGQGRRVAYAYVAAVVSVLTGNRDFRRLFLAELVVFGGDWFALIPLVTLLQRLTGGGLLGAVALAADTAVVALVLPFAGTVADRFDRRKVMVTAALATAVAVGLLFAVRSASTAWLGPVAIGVAAAAKAFYGPAAGAALPNVVDERELPAANTLGGSAWGTMLVLGASLGGIMSAAFGPYVCFAVTVVCLLLATVLVWQIRRPMQAPRDAAPVPPLRAIRESLAYIRQHPRVLSLVTVKCAAGLGNGVLGVFPVLATVVFSVGSIGTGLLFAARGLGALIGPLLLRRVLGRRSWLMASLAISMLLYGAAYLGVAASPWFWLVLVLVGVAHMAGGANWVISNFALQLEVPDALRGRVFATDMMLAMLAVSVSLLVVGAVVDHLEPRVVVAACAAVTMLYGLGWRLATRRLMRTTEQAAAAPAG
jgi:MFS family permease